MNKVQQTGIKLIKAGLGLMALIILLPIALFLMVVLYSIVTSI